MTDEFAIIERLPTVEEYIKLRNSVEWGIAEKDTIQKGLNNSLYSICIEYKGEIVGMGRVIGDGALACYMEDFMVLPGFQKRGVGKIIVKTIAQYIKNNFTYNTIVGGLAAKDAVPFYSQFKFLTLLPDETHGPGALINWSELEKWENK